ncbi:MAG: type II toxin-antitoxin system Phd/YefM family antitoxin [Syntrophomonadaceae bacterium]|nr:type II toxin-antitoxin system Phd/YefM family antitoxin [Syntrophomonadaceae bacterium]
MQKQVNIHEAKTHFSKLLARVRDGEEVIIANAGIPVARLVPVKEQMVRRVPGSAKGRLSVAPDFNAPLPGHVMEEFEQ